MRAAYFWIISSCPAFFGESRANSIVEQNKATRHGQELLEAAVNTMFQSCLLVSSVCTTMSNLSICLYLRAEAVVHLTTGLETQSVVYQTSHKFALISHGFRVKGY